MSPEDRTPAEGQPCGVGATALEGLVWHSLVYTPHNTLDGLTGQDRNIWCEAPRHTFGDHKPQASWLELMWYPQGDKTVARAWKTCEECHVGMAQLAENVK